MAYTTRCPGCGNVGTLRYAQRIVFLRELAVSFSTVRRRPYLHFKKGTKGERTTERVVECNECPFKTNDPHKTSQLMFMEVPDGTNGTEDTPATCPLHVTQ